MKQLFHKAKEASRTLMLLTDEQRNDVLLKIADRACGKCARLAKA